MQDSEYYKRECIETRKTRTPLESVVPLAAPFTIFIDPCGACNFKCSFCPCNTTSYKDSERHAFMPLELFKKIIDDISDFNEEIKVIALYAFGEPLLHKSIAQMISLIKQKNICREIRLTTNGSLLNPSMNEELINAGLDLLRVSIEALDGGEWQRITGVKFDFDNFYNNYIDYYKRGRGKSKLSAKITNASLRSKDDYARFFDMFGAVSDYTNVTNVVDGWSEFEEYEAPRGVLPARDNGNTAVCGDEICSYPLTTLTIHSNGMVASCPQDWKFKTSFGDAKTQNIVDIWRGKALRDFQLMHVEGKKKQIPFCSTCICIGDDRVDGKIIAQKLRSKIL